MKLEGRDAARPSAPGSALGMLSVGMAAAIVGSLR